MGFYLQLKLLLWKNFTLKKRKPLVLVFEITIPLVLFLIVIGIRQKQPAVRQDAMKFSALPLPSAGVIPIMQSFCAHEDRDENGFSEFSNATVRTFLEKLNTVAEHHNYFQPGITPSELDEIPAIYRSIIEDPVALHSQFQNATEFHLGDLLVNRRSFEKTMYKNFSFNIDDIATLVDTPVDMKQLYNVLFYSESHNDAEDVTENQGKTASVENIQPGLPIGLLFQIVPSPLETIMPLILTNIDDDGSPVNLTNSVKLLKAVLLSPRVIRLAACHNATRISVVNSHKATDNATDQQHLESIRNSVCSLNDQEMAELSAYLNNQISDEKLISVMHLREWNLKKVKEAHLKLARDLPKFMIFKRLMLELSEVASALPQDVCLSVNDTDAALNSTASPTDDSTSPASMQKKMRPQYGLVRIWMALQKQLCGKETVLLQPDRPMTRREELTLDDLDLTKQQREQIDILVHVLYSNPKVLYAPNQTDADKIIQKANETFELLDGVTQFAHKLTNISNEIQEFLSLEETEQNLIELREIQERLKRYPYLLALDPNFRVFAEDTTIPNKTVFVQQLEVIDNAACSWVALLSNISLNVFHGFKSEKDLIKYFRQRAYFDNVTVLASVIFKMLPNGAMPNHMIYTIRQNASFTITTNLVRGRFWFPGPRNWGYNYYHFGFVWIQDILERAMISLYSGRDVIEPGSYIHQFPYPCFVEDEFLFMIEHVMPLCLAISWVYLVAMLVQNIVHEKEQRLKEVMKMMGLTNGVHWVAWFITSFVQMSVTVVILTLILKYGLVLTYSDPILIFLVLEIFAVVNIVLSFLVSVLYSKAKLAAACAGIIYFLSYVPYMYIAVREEAALDTIPGWLKTIACLLSTTAFGMGAKYFAFYEEMGVGVQWSNINKSPVEDDEFDLAAVIRMMLTDIVIYAILTWYIENVHPGSYGLPKPWNFPFTKAYWFGYDKAEEECFGPSDCFSFRNSPQLSVMEEEQACAMLNGSADSYMFEPEPGHLPLGVCIDNLVKVFKGTNKIAVNKLSLNLFESQITSFLGHNGAGKTTTMSILTGLFPPTSGYAIIYNHDIRTEMDKIRKSLGMCPQHNVLFDELTVEEHLWFYARLKGMPTIFIKTEMDKLIEDVGLPMKRHQKVDCLSGGMKRKLSVGIAFVGGSRTVILDEPTAGVDPYARRAIWDLIIKYKQGRTILLSTHHMDEADILGDRIAIIANGQLKCCGTSLFLKNNLGDGYHLYIVKQPADENGDESEMGGGDDGIHTQESFFSQCKGSSVTQYIQQHVSTAYLVSETKHELHYVLPISELKKGSFEKLFENLEQNLTQLHIRSYGIKNTTLEEVFLKVAEGVSTYDSSSCDSDSELESLKNEALPSPVRHSTAPGVSPGGLEMGDITNNCDRNSSPELTSEFYRPDMNKVPLSRDQPRIWEGSSVHHVEGHLLLLQQFWTILVKRYLCTKRNWKGLFSQILLPAFFVSVAMSVALTAPQSTDLPPLILSPSQYYNYTQPLGNVIPFANHYKKDSQLGCGFELDASACQLEASLRLPSGVGATCVLKNSSLFLDMKAINMSENRDFSPVADYFEPMCASVFVPGLKLENFVPQAITVHPSPKPDTDNNSSSSEVPASNPPSERLYPSCHCSEDGTGFICSADGYKMPDSFKVVTGDIMLNLTDEHEHGYYLHTTDMYRLRRYGALSFGHVRSFVPRSFGKKAPALFRKIAVRNAAKIWFNNKGFHSMPTYINTLNNAILRANLNVTAMGPLSAYGITVINHPMVDTNSLPIRDQILQGTDVLIAIFIIVAMSFVPASFVLFLVYERYTKAKHLQTVSGVHPVIYWVANYFWDMCNYVVPATCCVLILRIFNIPAYVAHNNFPAVVSLFLMYGWSITPVMYPASFLFKEPSTAYIFLIVINLFIGITCVVTSFLLEVFSSNKFLGDVHTVLKPMFLMFPNYCLGRGLMDIAFNEYNNFYLLKTGQYERIRSPFAWPLVTRNLVAMAVSGIVFFIITLLCEYKFFWKPQRVEVPCSILDVDEDEDVETEQRRVLRGISRGDLLRLEGLTKVYHTSKLGRYLAVDRLCLGIPEGECFGLLGVNGAGKSTTFKMLSGDTSITAGDAILNGFSVKRDLKKVQQFIGYCPQFDALYDELTAREHLTLYARFSGVPISEEKAVVGWALQKLDLLQYADRPSGTYSGGNKRKLSTAIALIGGPPVIYLMFQPKAGFRKGKDGQLARLVFTGVASHTWCLPLLLHATLADAGGRTISAIDGVISKDEPTTGMDPYSRRFLWNLIISLIKEGRSIVFTSHSMEECEALCTRLAIMVNGRFRCLGSIQHLKNRFGDGYSILVRTRELQLDPVLRFFRRTFPDAVLKEKHHNIVQYELKSSNISLAYVFSKMEAAVEDLPIEDYSVSQNTLDNVFINFVKQQSDMSCRSSTYSQLSNQDSLLIDSCDDDVPVLLEQSGTRLSFLAMEVE